MKCGYHTWFLFLRLLYSTYYSYVDFDIVFFIYGMHKKITAAASVHAEKASVNQQWRKTHERNKKGKAATTALPFHSYTIQNFVRIHKHRHGTASTPVTIKPSTFFFHAASCSSSRSICA